MLDKNEFLKALNIDAINHRPHMFCVSARHVSHAADHFGGMLGSAAIKSLEEKTGRPSCGVRGCNEYYEGHTSDTVLFILFVDRDKKYRIAQPKHRRHNEISSRI